jgi:hypothetical protein
MANADVEVARGYHERTKHSEERLRASPHHLDWDNQAVPFKLYRDLETIPLPRQLEPGTVSALRAISALVGRETELTEQVPGLQALARVLYYSAGITKVKRPPAATSRRWQRPTGPSSVRSISVSFEERWPSSRPASKPIGSSPSPSQALAST